MSTIDEDLSKAQHSADLCFGELLDAALKSSKNEGDIIMAMAMRAAKLWRQIDALIEKRAAK